ncbi:hypothetical protein DES40_2317 [Litorimonas taeanensis]|uniref:Peptidase C39-like protein n=1 Tax=Litorimonas taeanensis TaxID=568099 RepID=A0A420WEW0_9PROT|nr:hypothetical protein [Litorimonas taeanensis]RKQ69516.1 hypothetical protein DES40_2317 [Litorimonas taeanensis]
MKRLAIIIILAVIMTACSSTPRKSASKTLDSGQNSTPLQSQTRLPDYAAFYQKDPRWGHEELGNSGDTMASDGCLVTAVSMALANLGFETNPSDLNKRLTYTDSFTPRGWLIWDGIRKVTGGKAKAQFHESVSAELIEGCMAEGYYPLVQFILPNGRTHWALILDESSQGYLMRDPLRQAKRPLIFPHTAEKFRALRCVGLA